jgi:hypothetical protein
MKGSKPDENIRRPMQWTNGLNSGFTSGTPWRALNSNYTTFNLASLQLDENSIWHHYKKLIEIRKLQPILQTGTHKNIISTEYAVHSYQRSLNGKDVLVLVNTSPNGLSNVQMDITKSDSLSGNYQIEDIFNDSIFSVSSNSSTFSFKVNLQPYQTRILQFGYPVGMDEENENRNIKLYPNPAKDYVQVDVIGGRQFNLFEAYNLQGELVQTERIEGQQNRVKLSLAQGVYLIKLSNTEGQSSFKKLVVE